MPAHTIEAPEWKSFELLQLVLDSLSDPIFVKDRQHRWIAFNESFCRLLGRLAAEILGRSDPDFFPPEQVEVFWTMDDALFQSGEPNDNEELVTRADGAVHTIWTRKFPLKDGAGEVIGLCGIISDLTHTAIQTRIERAERAAREYEEQRRVLEAQNALIDALAVPMVEVWSGILLVPLVGEISARRAGRVLERLLEAIVRTGAETVIVDVTGVPVVDAQVAGHLVRTVQAAALLGATSVLCGIGPDVARTLVALEVDLGRVITRGSLKDALEQAIARRAARR
jgi:rsbT co-antagonist protein RsbR